MLNKVVLIVLVLFIFSSLSCSSSRNSKEEKIIFVSIPPLKNLVEEIVGNDYQVKVLLPDGINPEVYEITPDKLMQLESSEYVYVTGLIDFEKIILDQSKSKSKVIDLSHGVDLISGNCGHTHAGMSVDPHIWLSPSRIAIMSQGIINSLPNNCNYKCNLDNLLDSVKKIDVYIKGIRSKSTLPYFIIYHPSLTYFAADYNAKQVAIEDNGKEPGIDQIKQIIMTAKRDKIKYLYIQSEINPKIVDVIAEEMNVEIITINPLNEKVLENIKNIADLIFYE